MRRIFFFTVFFFTVLGTIVLGVIFSMGVKNVFAYEIQTLPGTAVEGDIVLGPGKIEVWLEPGEKTTRTIYFTNRTGRTIDFLVNIEDFKGSRDPKEGTIFMGEEKGPYSLKDYLHPEVEKFTLEQGQRIHLPIEIAIPEDAEPGGRYGVVFVAALPPQIEVKPEGEEAKPMVGIISRVGCLFFVRVKGEVIEDGYLKSFETKDAKKYFEKGPINFELLSENKGNVHLASYGTIEITNLLGKKVGELEVDPYFSIPNSVRLREIKWDKELLFGRYIALAKINRGYQDIIDQKSFDFWVIPWKVILAGLVSLFLIILFFKWLASHFEIKRKTM